MDSPKISTNSNAEDFSQIGATDKPRPSLHWSAAGDRLLPRSDSPSVLRRLSLFWGVTPIADAPVHDGPALRAFIDSWGRDRGLLSIGDRVIFVTGTNFYPMAQNIVVIHEVE